MPKACPKCNALWEEGDRFCGHCGAPLRTVRRARDDSERQLPAALLWLMDLCPGVFKPTVLVMSLIAIAFALVAFWLALFLFTIGGLIVAFAIGGGGVIIYWTALSWLLYGYVCVPAEAMAEFQGKHWMVLALATAIPGCLFLLLMKAAAAGQ